MSITEMTEKNHQSSALTHDSVLPEVRPPVDVFENDDEILVYADLPGVPAQNLHVRLEEGELTLEGRFEETEQGETKLLAREYRPVLYRRSFVVPEGIDPAGIKAKLSAGVVTVHLPKAEAFRPREIQVQAG